MSSAISKFGMVCTGEPRAAEAGADILRRGGNAVDAAVATAACLTVTEPVNCGIGGDAFAQIYFDGKLYGLNGSGPSPQALDTYSILNKSSGVIAGSGWDPVTVPGIPACWEKMIEDMGSMPFREVLAPAISLAKNGHAVTPVIASLWQDEFDKYSAIKKSAYENGEDTELFSEWFRVYAPGGRAPACGEKFINSDLGNTLEIIADRGAYSFYQGVLAEKIIERAAVDGAAMSYKDLAEYNVERADPIAVPYRNFEIYELPPNGQGLVVLEAMKILGSFDLSGLSADETAHLQIESLKLAFADGLEYIADPKHMIKAGGTGLLADPYIRKRAEMISDSACIPVPGDPGNGDTVYLCTADRDGNMVSFIQSNFNGFGSGIVIPGTGITLNDRGCCFSTDPRSPNFIAPGKKPYHTIIPGFLMKDGKAAGPFGVMGQYMQPQGHLQILSDIIDFGMDPQDALALPRWQWTGGDRIEIEECFDRKISDGLSARGHDIVRVSDSRSFGRGQVILRRSDGSYVGGSEPRTDGKAAFL